jgi:drug/metabolite transporter (DMT)-like permease
MEVNYIPLLGSEIALSLYPQLIKLIPTTIELQVAVRCITYSVLAIIGYYITTHNNTYNNTNITTNNNNNTNTTTNTFSFIITTIVMGLVNSIHIFSSYICFNTLSSGVGYSIFYIYPIFNLLGRTLIYNEKIDSINYLYILISILGVYLIYKNNNKDTTPDTTTHPTPETIEHKTSFQTISDIINTKNKTIGLFSGIISALTESIIYFMVKDNLGSVSPFIQLFKSYLFGGILSIIYLIQNSTTNLDYHYWITLILFNALIGFVGYLLRFIMIPKLSTLLFNSLIFTGVIFSYSWGYLLSNEPITYNNLYGTLLIVLSIVLINKK